METQGNGKTRQTDAPGEQNTPPTSDAPQTPRSTPQDTTEAAPVDRSRRDHTPPSDNAPHRQETPRRDTPALESRDGAQENHAPQQQKTPAERAMDRSRSMFDQASSSAAPVFVDAMSNAPRAIGKIAANPVGNLPRVRSGLGAQQALGVSVVFVVVAAVCLTVGVHQILDSVLGFGYDLSFGTVVQLFGAALASFVSLFVLHFAARKAFSHEGDYGDDTLVAGAALLPMSVAVLVIGLVGISHYQIAAAVGVFATCYVVLILYAGLARLAEAPEAAAAPLVPVILILSAWLARVLFGAIG